MDKDIQEMFKKKNKEILINNLKLDVDRNIEVLKNTIDNIFEKEFESAIKNINSMYEDSFFDKSLKKVDTILNDLKKKSLNNINLLIDDKKEKLVQSIDVLEFEEEKLEDYYKLVFDTTSTVISYFDGDDFYNLRKKNIDKFSEYSISKLDLEKSNITNSRINDYITYRLFGKIKERIKSELFIRDNSLKNKACESYRKYQELEMMTVGR